MSQPDYKQSYKISNYFQLFDGSANEPAVGFNSLTGGTYAFSNDAIPALIKLLNNPNDVEIVGSDLFEFLKNERIIISHDFDELEYLKSTFRDKRSSKEELYVTYSLTNACNFRCAYCYQEHKNDILSGANLDKTYGYIRDKLPPYNKLKVHWFGGEPLLRLHTLEEASKNLIQISNELEKDYAASITTNGSLFNANAAQILKSIKVKQVQFTLDGAKDVHDDLRLHKNGSGTYDSIVSAIKIAIAEGFTVFIRINLSQRTLHLLREMLDDLRKQGIGPENANIYINEMKQHGYSKDDNSLYFSSVPLYADSLVEALRVLKEFGYQVPKLGPIDINCVFDKPSSVLFGTDGNLYHCTTGTDSALGVLDARGALVEESERRRVILSREPWEDPHCASCKSLPICMGGCAYLDEEGKTKCNPEGFVVEQLLRLNLPA